MALNALYSGSEKFYNCIPTKYVDCSWSNIHPKNRTRSSSYVCIISRPSTLLLLLLSRFSRVRLYATPEMAAHQAPLSLGFCRQEHWSGLPFPSPMHESEKWKWSRSVVSDSSRPHGVQPTRLLHPWDFPGKSTGVGCHCLLQEESRASHILIVLVSWSAIARS